MVPKWLLVVETIALGLLVLGALPVWSLVLYLVGATEHAPARRRSVLTFLVLSFPVTAAVCLLVAWLAAPESPVRWICLGPLLHLLLLFGLRVPRKRESG